MCSGAVWVATVPTAKTVATLAAAANNIERFIISFSDC